MPKDTDTLYVAPDAPEILKAPPLRDFLIPFKIEGKMRIKAPDLDTAQILSEFVSKDEYAHNGDLETYDPEPIQ